MFTISIHALVKRATRKAALPYLDTIISIHALVKRATKYEEVGYYFFNISIHALVKRATIFVKRKSRKSDFGILPSNIISKRTFL